MRADEFAQFGRSHGRPWVQDDGGRGVFAQPRMRYAKSGGLRHLRMAQEGQVDFIRRDLLATAIDQLLLAAMERQESVRIEAADVSAAVPAVDENRAAALGRIQITGHDRGTVNPDFAAFAGGEWAAVRVGDLHNPHPGDTDGAEPRRTGRRTVAGDLRGLARTVVLQHRNAERRLYAVVNLARDRSAGC